MHIKISHVPSAPCPSIVSQRQVTWNTIAELLTGRLDSLDCNYGIQLLSIDGNLITPGQRPSYADMCSKAYRGKLTARMLGEMLELQEEAKSGLGAVETFQTFDAATADELDQEQDVLAQIAQMSAQDHRGGVQSAAGVDHMGAFLCTDPTRTVRVA